MQEQTTYIYLSPAFFFLHIINAYEHGDSLVIDICCYDNADMLKCMTIEALQVYFSYLKEVVGLVLLIKARSLQDAQRNPEYLKQFFCRPKRFVLPLTVRSPGEKLVDPALSTCQVRLTEKNKLWIEPELIIDIGCELPQLDYFNNYGKFYRYFYAINSDIDYEFCGSVRNEFFLVDEQNAPPCGFPLI